MKYTRNWAWDCIAEVELEKETVAEPCITNNKGQIKYLTFDGVVYDMDNDEDVETLKDFGVVAIHFTTPAKLTFGGTA